MNAFLGYNSWFSRSLKRFMLFFGLFFFVFAFGGCKKESVDYYAYLSELRSNILLAEEDGFSLRIYAVEKEYPYATDGIKRDTSQRAEIYLSAPSGEKTCNLSFEVDGKEYGGEMSFDNVKTEYYFSCALDLSASQEISCKITFGESEKLLLAKTVKTENTLTPKNILQTLQKKESELFASLTDEYGFAGEIYLRLIFEESPYYYVGVIDRNGKIAAFLVNAENGNILAKRQS
ncbi:MAG: hypothetical protein E7381_02510 [Clostridiales bacterium]|nr:hypothetical protein [Clostridiales bacterium]